MSEVGEEIEMTQAEAAVFYELYYTLGQKMRGRFSVERLTIELVRAGWRRVETR